MTVPETCISTLSSHHKGPCMPCIMQTGNLCPLSSFCGHCHACHSLLSAHATRRAPQPRRQRRGRRKIIGWPYLAICNKALKALVLQSRLDGYARNKRKAIIHLCFIFLSFEILLGYICTVSLREKDRLIF